MNRTGLLPDRVAARILRLAAGYPRRSSALLPALDLLHRMRGGRLVRDDVSAAAALLGMSAGEAWSAATSYPLFVDSPPGLLHIEVDDSVSSFLAGGEATLRALSLSLGIAPGETSRDGRFSLSLSRDLGAADAAPAVRVGDHLAGPVTADEAPHFLRTLGKGPPYPPSPCPVIHSDCGFFFPGLSVPAPADLDSYRNGGGYRALGLCRRLGRKKVLAAVARSGLDGRGGGGYPAASKWKLLDSSGTVYLICNADEGEPGTFKDRLLMELRPHLVLEGIAIAAETVGARRCFVYIRGSYRRAAAVMSEAAAAAAAAGLLGDLDITLHIGAGSYICGEETALIASLEGRRGTPSPKPPWPARQGLYGMPTLVHNVETLAALPLIISRGPDAFRRQRPRLYSVTGHVGRPGLYEVSEGTPLASLLDKAGGVRGTLKGLFLGGISQPVLTSAEAARLRLAPDALKRRGRSPGTGTVIVMNSGTPTLSIARRLADFFAEESCGQCAPCRDGFARLKADTSLRTSSELSRTLAGLTRCPAGTWGLRSLSSLLEKFPS